MRELDECVSVTPYQPAWPAMFASEHRRLREKLPISDEDLEHIGSTAVPALTAKPIIDLMLGVDQFPPSAELQNAIEGLGYEPLGEAGVPGRLYFRCRGVQHANLHVVLKGGAHWTNNLALREYLRTNMKARERYALAKQAAVASGARSLLAYSAAKADFVRRLLQEALGAEDQMHIRRALEGEADELSGLALRAKRHWGYPESQISAWRTDLQLSADAVRTHPTFVGELDGRVVGFYSLVPSQSAWELGNLWIEPAHMRRGYGRELLNHALRTATEGGATGLHVDADPNAEAFYVACGATRLGTVPAPIAGDPGRVRPQFLFACREARS